MSGWLASASRILLRSQPEGSSRTSLGLGILRQPAALKVC